VENATLTPKQFDDFREIINGQLGIKMPATKQVMLQSRLHRRLRELGMETFAEYHERFFSDPEHQAAEIEHLLNLATTNKTDFFREPDHFDMLARQVLPAWLREPSSPVFRVWCAGCATGEEPYTIAMTLLEQQTCFSFQFSILATDVSTRVLETAMGAVYSDKQAAPIPPALRAKYLLRSRDRASGLVKIAPQVRARVRFGHLNFLAPDYGLKDMMDVVFFRNVMIYFERSTQQEVVTKICRHLRPGGRLFVAHSESLQGLTLPLRMAGAAAYVHEPEASPP
jgi:chemotaxis protein methyltransferase CheR